MSKKIISFILILAVIISVNGCQKKEEKAASQSQPTQQTSPQQQTTQSTQTGQTPAQLGKGSTSSTAQASIPTEAKLNLQQGLNYLRSKDYDNAIKEFTLAIEKYPQYDVAYSNRAVAYMHQNKFNKALDDLKKQKR